MKNPKNPTRRTRRTQAPEEPGSSWKNPVLHGRTWFFWVRLGRTRTQIRYLGAGTRDGFENPTPGCGYPCNTGFDGKDRGRMFHSKLIYKN